MLKISKKSSDIFREGLNLYEKDIKKIEITSFADIHVERVLALLVPLQTHSLLHFCKKKHIPQ